MKKVMLMAMTLAMGVFASVESHWDGGRNTPVHRLALTDELGDTIMPSTQGALPVSTKQTCSQCHDYAAIASGWHFNMSNADAKIGRPSEPWFLVDAANGSQIPMSLRNWPGLYKPGQLGMSDWEFVYAFGRHMPGGDIADPKDRYAEGAPKARWEVSGPVEINCFACHSQDKAYDHSEWVRLISRQNFRWAATGALGLGEALGMGVRVDDYWGMLRGLNPDDSLFKVPPHINYYADKFDGKNRTVLEVGKPRSENCQSCHSTTQAGMGAKEIDGDVHARAGMTCVSCHRNGIDHAVTRGYAGDDTGAMDKTRATASCTGCHNGTDTAKAGRYGAPAPKHVGFPKVHFEKLNCTVCHAGVTENGDLAQVRTSRSNRMGVYGRARWVTPQPFIMEPVFVKGADGKLNPTRMVWPAYWGTAKGDAVEPIHPDRVNAICADLFDVRERVGAILKYFAANPNILGKPVWVKDKKVYKANADDVLVSAGTTTAENGFYYLPPNGLVEALLFFDPYAYTGEMTDEQKNVYEHLLAIFDAGVMMTAKQQDAFMADKKLIAAALEHFAAYPNALPMGKPVWVADRTVYAANADGTTASTGTTDAENGFYYQPSHGLLAALPFPNLEVSPSDWTDEQQSILTTLDAAEKAAHENLLGAVVLGSNVFYSGVSITTNKEGKVEVKPVVLSKPVSKPITGVTAGWITEDGKGEFVEFWDAYTESSAIRLADSDYSLTEEMLAAGLKRLREQDIINPVYVGHGQVWSLNAAGELVAKSEKVAEPVSWAVGRDVRPARMARGAKPAKCADCHTMDSKFFFAKVESTGPLLTARKMVKAQHEFMGASGGYNKLFGATFLMRPMFKIFLWAVFGFVALVAVAFAAAAVPSLLLNNDEVYGKHNEKLLFTVDKFAALGMVAAAAYQALSGIAGWCFHLMTGYVLIFHMVAGGLFAACLLVLIWSRGAKRIKDRKRSVLWLVMLLLGVCVLFTATAPMMTWFGAAWQLILLKGHRCATFCFLAVSVWMLISGGRKE